ncbi:MAG: YveK family protein, partial [Gaiellales bacterium]
MGDNDSLLPLLRRWWWLIVLGALAGGAVAFIVADRLQPEYEAEVGLLTGPLNTDEGTVDAAGSLARTYSELAVSGPLLQGAATTIGLTASVEDLGEAVTSTSNEISRLVTIRVRDTSPERASLFAQTLADDLVELSEQARVGTTAAVEELMQQQEVLLLPDSRQEQVREAATRIFGTPLAGRLSIVDPPEVPETPVAPQKRLITLLGALVGAVGAGVLARVEDGVGAVVG